MTPGEIIVPLAISTLIAQGLVWALRRFEKPISLRHRACKLLAEAEAKTAYAETHMVMLAHYERQYGLLDKQTPSHSLTVPG